MVRGPRLQTARLLLRRWRRADRAPFAAINADPEVMAHFPEPLTRRHSDRMVDQIEAEFTRTGFGLWAIELRATGEFVGFTGMNRVGFEAHFTPAVEVGWRLARSAWGHGYATEAAHAALRYGFDVTGLAEVVAFTAAGNRRSQAVMRRLGMTHDPADDFDHPNLPAGHRLRRHVLYRITPDRLPPEITPDRSPPEITPDRSPPEITPDRSPPEITPDRSPPARRPPPGGRR